MKVRFWKRKRGIFAICMVLNSLTPVQADDTFVGLASYYSDKLQGRRMSNGERYHKDSLTCAHRTLPFGNRVKVKNLKNGKEVILRVTDRGPFRKRYLIDVSRAAAQELGFIKAGHCKVEITLLPRNIVPFKMEEEKTEIPKLKLDTDTIIPKRPEEM